MNFSEFVDEGHTTFQPFDVNVTRRPYYGPMQTSHLIDKYVCPVLGIPGNILSMIIWLRRHVTSKNSSAIYLAVLAINDLVYIMSNLSAYWLAMYDFIYHILTLALITSMLEPLLVLGFSVERLIAISFPLRVRLLPRDALVHSAVLRLHVVRPSVRPSVCNVGGSGSHRLEILETNCTDS